MLRSALYPEPVLPFNQGPHCLWSLALHKCGVGTLGVGLLTALPGRRTEANQDSNLDQKLCFYLKIYGRNSSDQHARSSGLP